jgi:cbb3-type cytochrome oxidase maturation protein
MGVLVILIGCSLAVAAMFLGAFLWSVRSGQYDDTHTPGIRILFDDEYINQRDPRDANA